MGIDIEALSDYVETLMWGYARKGWLAPLPATLDRLRSNIDDPRWRAKIRGICALWHNDRDQAAKEIGFGMQGGCFHAFAEIGDVAVDRLHQDNPCS